MSDDPAIAAAQRAWENSYGGYHRGAPFGPLDAIADALTVGAREMATPLRQLHRPVDSLGKTGAKVCATCRDLFGSLAVWPCSSARLLYSSSELEGDSDAQ